MKAEETDAEAGLGYDGNALQKRSAPARPLCEEQPMADGQGIDFILFSALGR